MTLIQALVLGIVQGITEFLPISSSAHLIIMSDIFKWVEQPVEFDAAIHLATLFAVLIFFRSDIFKITKATLTRDPKDKTYRRLGFVILIATIPALVLGAVLKFAPENPFRNINVIVVAMIGWSVVMFIVDQVLKIPRNIHDPKDVTLKKGVHIGLAQALALIPGTSRSGITMVVGLVEGLDRPTAARFAFLLGIPVIAIAGVISVYDLVTSPELGVSLINLTIGFIGAFAAGILTIKLLLKFLQKHSFNVFVIYRIILGILLIILFW